MKRTNGNSRGTITIVGGGLAGLTAAIACARRRRRGATAGGTRGARRPRPQQERPLQGQPRPPRHLQGRPVLGLAGRARPAAGVRQPAAVGHPLPLAGQGPPHPAARHGSLRAAAARARSPGRRRLPQLGRRSQRRAHRRDALRRRRRLHLPPRPRRAVGGIRLEALGPGPAQPTAHRALPDRRLERAGRLARGRACAGSGSRSRPGTASRRCRTRTTIVATELERARELLGDSSLEWPSGNTVCLDLGIERRRGDPFVVSDLDEAGWIERFSAPDPSLAPDGEELVQAQMPVRPGESADAGGPAPRSAPRRLTARAGASARPGGGDRSWRPAPARSTTRARAGETDRRSTAATASFSPATWSPRPGSSPRFRGPARSRRAASRLRRRARPQLRRVA